MTVQPQPDWQGRSGGALATTPPVLAASGGGSRNWPVLVAACAPVSRCWLECT